MKKLIAALLISSAFATPAQAARGAAIHGWSEKLLFVAETNIPGESLCHLVKENHAMFLPYWTSSLGYAIASNGCDTDSYMALTPDMLKSFQETGLIPKDISPEINVPMADRFVNFSVLGVGAGLVLFGLGSKSGRRSAPKRVSGKQVSRGNRSQLLPALIDVMCAMSMIDGNVDQKEVAVISDVYQKMTGRKITIEQIAKHFQSINGPVDFNHIADVFNATEREILLEAAIRVATADGRIEDAEYEFIGDMTEAFDFGAEQIRNIMAHMQQVTESKQPRGGMLQPA